MLKGVEEKFWKGTIVTELKRTFDITSSGGMLVEILAAVSLRKGSPISVERVMSGPASLTASQEKAKSSLQVTVARHESA
jgi:hypothetical protein